MATGAYWQDGFRSYGYGIREGVSIIVGCIAPQNKQKWYRCSGSPVARLVKLPSPGPPVPHWIGERVQHHLSDLVTTLSID